MNKQLKALLIRHLKGSVDVVIANSEGVVQPLIDYSVEDFNHTLTVNITGVWLYFKHSPTWRTSSALPLALE